MRSSSSSRSLSSSRVPGSNVASDRSGGRPSGGPSIELVDVYKSYEEGGRTHEVLRGVSTVIGAGDRVALLGPSGSGKSTLLNLLSGIDLPDRGTIEIAGQTISSMTERDRTLFRRTRIGFVFQFFNLLPTLTVAENLLLPLELAGTLDPAGRARADRLLDAVGLAGRADAFPDRLSGGEQQRVAIVRALVHQPDLLLADEPTGNLDQDTGDRVVDQLESLVSEAGTTLIVVTHARDLAARMDRILEIDHGQLLERRANEAGA